MKRVGVLASGSGSNFQALVDSLNADPSSPARVVLLVCNVPGAKCLERAAKAGVPTQVVDHRDRPRDAFDHELLTVLRAAQIEILALAGFMRLVTPTILNAFPGRVVNVHPALLPAFPGLHGARQALAAGVKISGCTVHFVDEGTDTGPIISQAAVPVLPGDDEAALSARILKEEHRLFPEAIRALATGRLQIEGRRVIG